MRRKKTVKNGAGLLAFRALLASVDPASDPPLRPALLAAVLLSPLPLSITAGLLLYAWFPLP